MHGQNFLINQPLAIDKNYLLSLLPSIFLGYKNNSFLSSDKIEQNFATSIQNQIEANSQNGASKFPVIFNIIGPIVKYTDWNYLGTQSMMRILSSIDRNPNVSGVVLNIDSGGGMVSGTAEFADFISRMQKPTISYTNDYQCSAAEWIASACQYKMAGPFASAIGSIGTLMSFQDFSAMFEKWGAKIYEIYADQSSEKNIDFRELMKGNEKPYKQHLNNITDNFISTIKANYGEELKDDGHVYKGKTYTSEEALKIGLVQEIGTINDALAKF